MIISLAGMFGHTVYTNLKTADNMGVVQYHPFHVSWWKENKNVRYYYTDAELKKILDDITILTDTREQKNAHITNYDIV